MSQPLLFLNRDTASAILARFARSHPGGSGTSHATVRDFCESADELPKIPLLEGDLKYAQRPWAVKTFDVIFSVSVLEHLPPASLVSAF